MKVHPIRPEDDERAVEALARAFQMFPLNLFLYPDPEKRPQQLRWLYRRIIPVYRELGAAFMTEDGGGVAMWVPPHCPKGPGIWRFIRAGMLMEPFNCGLETMHRRILMKLDIERRHHGEMREPHWFLEIIGVDPAHQRRGCGKALLRHVLDQADRDGIPAYVITHDPEDVVYYQQNGFRLLTDKTAMRGAPPTYSLLRPATPPSG
ncbi:MAG: GNAT family N-acetyltransferase [Candidatus Hydrogenedens sp.]|nr:GNAT family N-acetyltransferase [Candidatus Hydrogenedentota bacterium]NLF56677.1 GNAT family N-acetyltransferase [Candidatus Hydrogenedens sp.]